MPLLRAPTRFPVATALLLAACLVTTLPLYFRRDLYLVIGAGHEDADNLNIQWWHTFSTTFIHGGGFPGITAHLVINGTMLLVLGGVLERTLGTGRFFALTAACLVETWTVKLVAHRPAHGISGVVWSDVDFAPGILVAAFRAERWRVLRDPLVLAVTALAVIGVLGIVNPWHGIALLMGLPFTIAWRRVLTENLMRIRGGEAPLVWEGPARTVGIVVPALLLVLTASMTLAALVGALR